MEQSVSGGSYQLRWARCVSILLVVIMVASGLAVVKDAARARAAPASSVPLFIVPSGTAPASPTPSALPSRELKMGLINFAIGTTNPIQMTLDEEYILFYNIYSTLITRDSKYNYTPDLALKWGVYNLTAWEFWLAPNAYFTDPRDPTNRSHPVTGYDVQWCYRAFRDNRKLMGMFTDDVREIRDVWVDPANQFHIRVDFNIPYAPALSTFEDLVILPKYIWETQGLTYSNPLPIGSGPLMVRPAPAPHEDQMLKPPPVLYMDKNPNWHGPGALGLQVFPSTVSVTNYLNSAAMSQDLTLGVIDVALQPEPTEWMYYLKDKAGVIRQSVPHAFVAEVGINVMTPELRNWDRGRFGKGTANPLLQNQAIRVAIAMITNRTKMIEKAMLGLGYVGDTIVPTVNSWHYDFPDYASTPPAWQNHSDPIIGPYSADEEFPDNTDAPGMQSSIYLARALLMKEGWRYACDGSPATMDTTPLCKAGGTDRLEFRFYTLSDVSWWKTAADGMVEDARRAGIQLDLTLYGSTQMNNQIWWPLDYDIWLWDWWFTPGSDPSTGILGSYTCEDLKNGTSNDNGFCLIDPSTGHWVYDEIYNQTLRETDVNKRRALTDQLQIILYQHASLQYPFYRREIYAMNELRWTHWGDWATHPGLPEDAGVNYLLPTWVWPVDHKPPQVPQLPGDMGRLPPYTGIVNVPVPLSVVATDPQGINLLYNWDLNAQVDKDGNGIFTDDNEGTSPSMNRVDAVYTTPGVYNVTVKVYEDPSDSRAEWFTVRRTTVTILAAGTGSPVITGLTSSPDDPDLTAPSVAFSAAAYDPAGHALSYKWNFGDGTPELTTDIPVASHTYAAANLYTVLLTVSSSAGSAQRSIYVNMVVNGPPVVSPLPSQTVDEGALVPFIAFATDPNSRDLLNYSWNFGDGTGTVYGNPVSHSYATIGGNPTSYTVTASVQDNHGNLGTATGMINVVPRGPNQVPNILAFSGTPNPATTTQDVVFTLSASDPEGNPLAWSIDFNNDKTVEWATHTPQTRPGLNQTFTATWRYATSGARITAKAYVDDGISKNQTQTYTMSVSWNDPPTLQAILATPSAPIPTELVTLSSTSADPNGDVLAYTWSYGDGRTDTGTTPPYGGTITTTHAYDAAGDYVVRLTVNDGKGGTAERTLTVSVVEVNRAPTLTDITAPRYAHPGDLVSFSADADDLNHDDLNYSWDYGEGAPVNGTTSVPATITGSHTYTTEAEYTVTLTVDDTHGGIVSKSVVVNITAAPPTDTTPPVTSIACGGAACGTGWYTAAVTVTLSATDDLSGVASTFYRVDTGSWTEYTAPFTISTDGSHTIDYNSTDVAGNTETPKSVTVNLDATPPTGSDTEAGTVVSGWYTTTVTVTLTGDDATSGVASIRYQIDGAGWHTYAAPFTVTAEGLHTVDYQVTDVAGLTSSYSTGINIDLTAPVTSANLAGVLGTNGWYTSSVVVGLAADDALSGVASTEYQVDGGGWQTYAAPFEVVGEGTHTVEFNSTDVADHMEATNTQTVKIDTVAPTTSASLAGTTSGSWYTSTVTVTLSATDDTSGVATTRYCLDCAVADPWTTYTTPFPVSAEGAHSLKYNSTDSAGNNEVTSTAAIDVDVTGPSTMSTVTGTTGADNWYTSAVSVTLAATDAGSGVASTFYRLDGGGWVHYTAAFPVSKEGTTTVEYNATDAVGHVETTKTLSIKIDTVSPTTTLTPTGTTGSNGWYKSAVSVSIAGTDATSGVATREYRIDGGAWQTYSAAFNVGEGTHTVEARVTDNAGRSTVQSQSLKIDATAPAISNLGPSGTVSSPVTVTWTGTDATSGIASYAVSVDGAAATSVGTTASTTLNLTAGDHTVTVTALDVAGNSASSSVQMTVSGGAGPVGGLDTMTLLIIVVVVAAAVLGAVWYVMRRRKASPPSEPPAAPPEP